ncbi:OmpH family outer membrane protein [Treponema sp.]|uniref:OmpH family outer membrane protein n=1 Tax=Treponema sp. TaxID=166 RepID=UPI00298E4946|nr:OmpH family outer membrane protein [Treponema sp.]MCR5612181.1 OmpH family outer membrane protein [Treponema sp.]
MKNFKRISFVLVLLFCAMSAMTAQQHITNFGIVDTNKVYEHFFKNSSAVKTYETKKKEMQKEITKRTDELRELKAKKDECDKLGDTAGAEKYVALIKEKTEYLRDFTTTKNLELQNLKKSLSESNEFYVKFQKTIKRVAENEGLSMVLSLQGESAILWYSQTVDITDKVIKELEK